MGDRHSVLTKLANFCDEQEAKIQRLEQALAKCSSKIAELEAENKRLRKGSDDRE